MKRTSLLVSYSSSDEEDEKDVVTSIAEPAQPPPSKKRKLPPLSESIAPPPPVDRPSLHQGRIRTNPHVEGQFAAHVYVSLTLRDSSSLYKLVKEAFDDSKNRVPILHAISQFEQGNCELHISLSRPIYLRAHQREDLKKAVKNIARERASFIVSFAAFTELVNDEKTRTFLAVEVGAGHQELRNLSDGLTPFLQSIRQKGYYDKPRFHASIAWALLPPNPRQSADLSTRAIDESSNTPDDTADFPTIESLPPDLTSFLNEKYCSHFASSKTGVSEVKEITVKIGKEVSSFRLKKD